MELSARKQLRLRGYDYSRPGLYFITICTQQRAEFFWAPAVGATCGRPRLSDYGIIVQEEIQHLNSTFPHVHVDKYVIMPNHVHLILHIAPEMGGRPQVAPTVPRIMKQFKGKVSKRTGFPIWQKSYHDHIIRSEADYLRIWEYIDNNPAKWQEDCYYVAKERSPSP